MADEPRMRASAEFDLIARIRERLGERLPDRTHRVGIGDDAAVTVPAGATATSVDALVDGVHFRSEWCPPAAAGHKAMATALSDLAAMGAEPGEAYLWLGRPPQISDAECLELCDGAAAVCEAAGAALLGGDLTAAPVLSLCATVVGHAPTSESFVGRAGASPGDVVCVTGALGGAAAGLLLLERPDLGIGVEPSLCERARRRQLRPEPATAAGRLLAREGASAMIDLSDGLGADAAQLAAASGVGIEIELQRVPADPAVEPLARAAGREAFELLASGGEDYELLCTLPSARLAGARRALGELGLSLSEIGSADRGTEVRLSLPCGRLLPADGHDHFDR